MFAVLHTPVKEYDIVVKQFNNLEKNRATVLNDLLKKNNDFVKMSNNQIDRAVAKALGTQMKEINTILRDMRVCKKHIAAYQNNISKIVYAYNYEEGMVYVLLYYLMKKNLITEKERKTIVQDGLDLHLKRIYVISEKLKSFAIK